MAIFTHSQGTAGRSPYSILNNNSEFYENENTTPAYLTCNSLQILRLNSFGDFGIFLVKANAASGINLEKNVRGEYGYENRWCCLK